MQKAPWQRTHTCGELRATHAGQTVVLNGWVNTYRSYNDQIFVDLRDRYGLTQVVFETDKAELFNAAQELRNEWVLSVRGTVRERLPLKHNPKLATGDIEVLAEELHILNRCPPPPFEVMSVPLETRFSDPELAGEDLRLQYRYLDLRRPTLQRTLALRHRLNKVIRDYLDVQGFLELETPLLGRSTPEGARDYLVPSRVSQDEKTGQPYWYALPQSPQLYKQLLMVSGYDKYFQIARCLRDEDLRADRQPEFTQLDVEMSFVEQNDILALIEGLVAEVFQKCVGFEIPLPLPQISYAESMLKYGNDKPDLRFGLEIVEVSDLAAQTTFPVFKDAVASGGKVRGLNATKAAEKFSRKELDTLSQQVEGFSAKELIWTKVESEKLPQLEKFLTAEGKQELRTRMKAEAGDLLLFVADSEKAVCQSLGNLRTHIATRVTGVKDWWTRRKEEEDEARKKKQPPPKFQYRPEDFKAAWIVDFPSFIWDEEEKRWAANHHPFTSPRDEDLPLLESEPAKVRAKAYDLVINGYEVGGGSIRIHNPDVQARLFAALGMSAEQARQRFGFLLDALKFGAPPHGGIAFGLDRLAMILAGTTNIRDVIAFPKNQKARDLMTGAPAPVDPKQLRELGL